MSFDEILDQDPAQGIAIVGMAGRFPRCRDVAELWQRLQEGVECISRFSEDELRTAGVPEDFLRDPNYVKAGAVLDDSLIRGFDAQLFRFTPREAEITDPQHRVFLECAWEALEDAGHDCARFPGAIGVYAGTGMSRYLPHLYARPNLVRQLGAYRLHLGNDKDFLPTLVSYKLDLRGPSVNVQSACSTSLVAVHMAVQSLLNGECDMALAGGVSITVLGKAGYFYREGGISSPDGHCRAFDAQARGTVGGNGAGVVVLRRLADALAGGDPVRAVILGSAINNDGAAKVGFTAPGLEGQARVISEALAVAQVEPETIGYVEAHGTGTSLGDPIEVAALTQAFGSTRRGFCALGSAKTNLGHLDVAAGVAGLIKAVLALQHRTLPASLGFERPNPRIDFTGSPFYVNGQLSPWPADGTPRRAGVSSFGIGGTNAHVVLQEAPGPAPAAPSRSGALLVLSARGPEALGRVAGRLADHLEGRPDLDAADLADIAFTLQVGRRAFEHRRALVCRDREEAVALLRKAASEAPPAPVGEAAPPVAFLFPGQGSQVLRMGEDLYREEPVFRAQVDRCCRLLEPHLGMALQDVLFPAAEQQEEAARQLRRTEIAQPALFTIEHALACLWRAWGVEPRAFLGHSLGEWVAACLAGVFTLEDALALVALRGRLVQGVPEGRMIAVPLAEAELTARLGEDLALAAVNAPSRCVVSGPREAVERLARELREGGTPSRPLEVTSAFHSPLVEPAVEPFVQAVARVPRQVPAIPFLSNVTGRWITAEEAVDPAYWGRQLRRTVRFSDGVAELHRGGFLLLEAGPGRSLGAFAAAHPEDAGRKALFCLDPPASAHPRRAVLSALGELWQHGVAVDWEAFQSPERRRRVPLPGYPFERQPYWIPPPRQSAPAPAAATADALSTAPPMPAEPPLEVVMPELQAPAERSSRRQQILDTLKSIVHSLTGIDPGKLKTDAHFLEVGVDSLLLIQATQAVEERCGVKVSIVQLLEELTTLDLLADHLDERLPLEPEPAAAPAPEPPSARLELQPAPFPAPRPAEPVLAMAEAMPAETSPHQPAADSLLERILARQLQVMSEQLQLLRGAPVAAPALEPVSRSLPSPAPPDAAPPVPPAGRTSWEVDTFVPYQAISAETGDLDARQREALDAFIERYTARTAESRRLAQRYRPVFADGRVTARFRRAWKDLIYPLTGSRSQASRIWDVDGNEYVDVAMGYGVHLFGHSPPFLVDALQEQLQRGLELAPRGAVVGEVAELFCELSGQERVAFCNSGTEAVMAALRAARTVTRRQRIALFAGAYHGWADATLARSLPGGEGARPVAPGVPNKAVEDVLVLAYDRPESLDRLAACAHELAAVLVEPVQSRRPDVQPAEFLRRLREITRRSGTVLIFDEMVTGFRVHPGGAQAWFGVQADLATYGKVIGGGLPIGAVAGAARIMDVFDGGAWSYGDSSYPAAVKTLFGGAFFANPLTIAAMRAVFRTMQREGPALQERVNQLTARLAERLNGLLDEAALPIRVAHFGSLFRFLYPGQLKHLDLLFYHLIEKGVFYAPEVGNCFLSTAHTEEDVDRISRALERSLDELQGGGFLPGGPGGRRQRHAGDSGADPARSPAFAVTAPSPAAPMRAAAPAVDRPTAGIDFSLYFFGNYEAEYRSDKYDLLFQATRFADERGFRAVWLPERHFHAFGGLSPNPSVLAAALARETRRLEIRAGSVVLPLHHPVRVAEEWALLDNLAGGRVGVSFASGWHPNDFVFAPESYADRHAVLMRGIDTVRRLWRGEAIPARSGTGQELSVRLHPLPARPELPIWLTGTSPDTYRRAGQLGAGVVTNLQEQTLEEVGEKVALYHRTLAEHGHDPRSARVTVLLHTYLEEDAAQARERARGPFCAYLRSNLGLLRNRLANDGRPVDLERLSPGEIDYLLNASYDRWVASSTLIGSIETGAELLPALGRAGVTEVGCLVDFGVERAAALESLERVDALRRRLAVTASPTFGGERPAGVPLTEAQRALWVLTQMGPEVSRAYNESINLHLRGDLRRAALHNALQEVVDRHEALRARFPADGESQWTAPPEPLDLPLVDLSGLPPARRGEEAEARSLEWAQTPLDLEHGPLLRIRLLRLGAAEHRLVLTTHHLAVDGHATSVILRELSALYSSAVERRPVELPRATPFREYVRGTEADGKAAARLATAERYWLDKLQAPLPVLDLPVDRPRPAVKRYGVARCRHTLPADLTAALRKLSRQQGCTLFMTLLAGFKALLFQLTGQRDVIVGINAAPPADAQARTLVGFRISTLPIRTRIEDGPFSAHLARLKRAVAEGYEHQGVSTQRLLKQLPLQRDPSRPPLVSVVFDLERSGPAPAFGGLEVEVDANPVGAKMDLYLNVLEGRDEIVLQGDFAADLFAPATVRGWLERFQLLLAEVVEAPESGVTSLSNRGVHEDEEGGEAVELSRYQRLLWTAQKLSPEAPLLVNAGVFRLGRELDVERFRLALRNVIDRSDALRTVIDDARGVPVQWVRREAVFDLVLEDTSAAADPAAEARARAETRCRVPLDWTRGVVDSALYRLGPADYLWYLNLHHAISDAWSVALVLREAAAVYQLLGEGAEAPREPLAAFRAYLDHERALLESAEGRDAEAYWKRKLAEEIQPVSFYGSGPRRSTRVERVSCRLGRERTVRLKSLAADEPFFFLSPELSLLSLLGACVGAWLSRVTDTRELALGVPFHNRTTDEMRRTIGLFMQILPQRIELGERETFASLAEKIASENLESLQYRSFPVGNPTHRRAYEVELNYVTQALGSFDGAPVEFEWLHPGHGGESLAVQLHDLSGRGELVAEMDFHADLFSPELRTRAVHHFLAALDAVLESPRRRIDDFPLLDPAEQAQVRAAGGASPFPLDVPFVEAFRRQAGETPDRIAVRDDQGELSYAGLSQAAGALAAGLRALGAGPESVIALLGRRDRSFLAAILAVFETGAAYLPVDPSLPMSRIADLLRRSGARVAAVAPDLAVQVAAALEETPAAERPALCDLVLETGPEQGFAPRRAASRDRLSYVIYTSGSTGLPKGAMVHEAGMLNHLYAKVATLALGPDDVLAQTAPQAFDISVWQFLAPLLVGGRVAVLSDEALRDPLLLVQRVAAEGVTVLEIVPSLLRAVLDVVEGLPTKGRERSAFAGLRWLMATGEALPADVVRRWLALYPAVPLVNAYGPTECSDDVLQQELRGPVTGPVPIGSVLANLHGVAVDRAGFPVPAGVAGELWIGGVGVGRGYLHDPARTAQAFVPDPFSGTPGARAYRTGDLVRFRPEGWFEFLGRIDHQVKIRGHRIELGEIEATLGAHPTVRETVVVAREDAPGDRYLAAYVASHGTAATVAELRGFLRDRLPEAMVPVAFVFLDALPLNANGKVDRARLPMPAEPRQNLEAAPVLPRNPLEEAIAGVWSEVLGLNSVGVDDNFFEMGGDSILSIQIASRAQRAGIRIRPMQLFEHPTVARLAAVAEFLESRPAAAPEDAAPATAPLTPVQRWFFGLELPNPHHWNQAVFLEVREALAPGTLRAAFREILTRHDALRLRFHPTPSGWEQRLAPAGDDVPFSVFDLGALPADAVRPALEGAAAALGASFHLTAGPLVRAAWFELGPGQPGRLLLAAHHLVVDGVSWRILLEELEIAYRSRSRGLSAGLPPSTTPFLAWARRLDELARSAEVREEVPFWTAAARREVRALPRDHQGGQNSRDSARGVSVSLDPQETEALLKEVPSALGAQIDEVLLAALATALAPWSGAGALLVDLEGHGREALFEDVDLSRTVGWFTAIAPVLIDPGPEGLPEQRLERVCGQLRAAPRKGIGFGLLRYGAQAQDVAAALRSLPPAEVVFNYLGRLDQAVPEGSVFRLARESAGPMADRRGSRRHVFEINGLVAGNRLRFEWAYSCNLHEAATVERLANGHLDRLRDWIAHARARQQTSSPAPASPAIGFRWSDQQRQGIADLLEERRSKPRRRA